jgi:PAS domain S-box-containing protein
VRRSFRQFAENSRDVFWMYDAIEEQHLYISPAYERIWGQTRENLYANPYLFLETIHPEDQERVRVAIETTRQGENQDIEYRIVRPNGEVRWISDRGFPIRNPSGQIYRFAGIAEDITDRKQAEEQQQKFVALIENSSDFIGMATLEGIPFFLNEAGRRLVGLDSLEEVRSTDIFVYHTPESEALFRDIARPTCMATGHWEGEGVFRHFKTGKPIDVYINVFLVGNPQKGEPLCMATVTRDITERKQAEEKIKASLQEKEILLQEIYHRVKNNLQIISSLLDLQSQRIQEPHILEMFQSSQNRIRSMALLHENLYKSENLANVNFADYIYRLTTHLFQTYAINADNITLQTNDR